MTDIIDLIDSATGCQGCEGPLGSSPSDEFCSERCQQVWSAKRIGAQLGSDYFLDMATMFRGCADYARGVVEMLAQTAVGRVHLADGRQASVFADGHWEPFGTTSGPITFNDITDVRDLHPSGEPEPEPVLAERMEAALEARRNRNTGPPQRERAARRIDPRRSR